MATAHSSGIAEDIASDAKKPSVSLDPSGKIHQSVARSETLDHRDNLDIANNDSDDDAAAVEHGQRLDDIPEAHNGAMEPSGHPTDKPNGASQHEDEDRASIVDGPLEKIPMVQYRGFASRLTAKQRIQEVRFLTSQIESLELQRDTLEDLSSDDEADSESETDNAERPRAIPGTKRVDWHDFKTRHWCSCLMFTKWATEARVHRRPHAIEVLVGKARYYWEVRRSQWMQDPAWIEERNLREEHDDIPIGKLPQVSERIRINSRPILAFLASLTDSSDDKCSRVMLRPYKLLIRHEKAIRQKYQELKQNWGSHTNAAEDQASAGPGNNSERGPTPAQQQIHPEPKNDDSKIQNTTASAAHVEESSLEKEDAMVDETSSDTEAKGETTTRENGDEQEAPILDSFEAYTDFKCLVNFIDEDIVPVTEAYRNRASSTAPFHDLWHLFKPGDHVLVKDTQVAVQRFYRAARFPQSVEKNQVYRVFHVTGGRPYLRGALYEDKFSSPKVSSSFTISAYRIAFDGTTFGTVHGQFHISPFKGEKEITSLGVFPLRFDPNSDSIEFELVASGKKFLELTIPRHLMYRGMTAITKHDGELCPETARAMEEINGQVVVNFKEARQENLEWITSHSKPQPIDGEDHEFIEDYENTVWENENERDLVCMHNDVFFEDHTVDKVYSGEHVSKNPFLSSYQDLRRIWTATISKREI